MSENYTCKIIDSSRPLTFAEKMAYKDPTWTDLLDDHVHVGAPLDLRLDYTVTLAIHNESAKEKDYKTVVLVSCAGTAYRSSSRVLMDSLAAIADDLKDEKAESGKDYPFDVRIMKMDSGKQQPLLKAVYHPLPGDGFTSPADPVIDPIPFDDVTGGYAE